MCYLPDGRLLFSKRIGHLYLIEPAVTPARVQPLGWLHTSGSAYTPSLFALGGSDWIGGVVQRQAGFDCVLFELKTHASAAVALDTKGLKDVLRYGSISRDDAGRAYVGGCMTNGRGGQRPLLLQLDPGR